MRIGAAFMITHLRADARDIQSACTSAHARKSTGVDRFFSQHALWLVKVPPIIVFSRYPLSGRGKSKTLGQPIQVLEMLLRDVAAFSQWTLRGIPGVVQALKLWCIKGEGELRRELRIPIPLGS